MSSRITLQVPSIHCHSCETYVQSTLSALSLDNLSVDLLNRSVSFISQDSKITRDVERLLGEAGYEVQAPRSGRLSLRRLLHPFRSNATLLRRRHLEHCEACARGPEGKSSTNETALEKVVVTSPSAPQWCETVFGVEGMTCSSCTQAIQSVLSPQPAIKNVNISLLQNSMKVTYDPASLTANEIVEAVEGCGFGAEIWETRDLASSQDDVEIRTIQLRLDGMFCSECPQRLNERLHSLNLKSFTPLSTSNPITTILYHPTRETTVRTIISSFPPPFSASVHRPPSLHSRSRALQAAEARKLTRLFLLATLFAIPTFIIGIVGMVLLKSSHPFRKWCDRPVWGSASRGLMIVFALATVVQFGIGRVFYERAFAGIGKSLKSSGRRKWKLSNLFHFGNMDLLVALSTSVAYVSSVAMMALDIRRKAPSVSTSHDMHETNEPAMMSYFDSCVFLVFFILMGRVLEGRARVKTGDAIAMLGAMRPDTVLLVSEEEKQKDPLDSLGSTNTTTIPTDHLEIGDRILLRPGSIPPADGTVVSGSTTTDESSLTGESLPVVKNPGDPILSGTTNLSSAVIVRVDQLGDATVLEKIVRAVAESQNKRAPIEQLADRITGIFVPIVIWLSVVVVTVWLALALIPDAVPMSYFPMGRNSAGDRVFFAFEFAIAVLVIACPCGIGLAAPTAQAVGVGLAAKSGVLAQGGGEAFQLASTIDTVVFDKTGTLTLGEANVSDADLLTNDPRVWAAVKSIEEGSSHPLGVALVRYCETRCNGDTAAVIQTEEIAGKGAKGVVRIGDEEVSIAVGNEILMSDVGATYPSGMDDLAIARWKSEGKSIVLVALSQGATSVISARFAIADPPRPEAKETIAALRKTKEVWMLSGDNAVTARSVAKAIGIAEENVVAGVLPAEKAAFIRTLQARTRSEKKWWNRRVRERNSLVMFVGEGLNDSAAVTAADAGVALSHGSQVTMSSAAFVLLQRRTSLTTIADLINLSRKVYLRQRLNFGWASIYNLAMIPLAAGAFYPANGTRIPPVWAAIVMACSSLSVVMSSLALKWGF